MVDSNLSDTISDLKAHARVLHKLALAGQPSALQRLRVLPEWSRAADEAILAGLQRRHCLGAVARQLGFQNWQHARAVLQGEDTSDFGTLLYPATCHGHWNIWSAAYDEAREIRAAHGGYLLAYRRQFLIVDQHYVESMGLDPEAADWTRIGRDWVRPGDFAARARLYRQLVQNALSLRVLRDVQSG
jgi:hypothetical protein